MNSTIIQVNDLTKRYRDVLAVDHISFEIGEGEIFGFLGPNGAGKTTTIRMLTTLSRACPLALPFSFASTALLPASSMPTWLRDVANMNPISKAADIIRYLIINGTLSSAQFTSVIYDFAFLGVFVVICTVIGVFVSNRGLRME